MNENCFEAEEDGSSIYPAQLCLCMMDELVHVHAPAEPVHCQTPFCHWRRERAVKRWRGEGEGEGDGGRQGTGAGGGGRDGKTEAGRKEGRGVRQTVGCILFSYFLLLNRAASAW